MIEFTLGAIAVGLVNLLPLAIKGRIVIIPNPFNWFPESKKIIEEAVESNILMSPELMSLLNMLSITQYCKIQPYTIAESEETFELILNNQINNVDIVEKHSAKYAYDSILGALLTEKLLSDEKINVVLNVPLSRYYEIINENKEFYGSYMSSITNRGALNADSNLTILREKILESINKRDNKIPSTFRKPLTIGGSIGGGVIGIAKAASLISVPIAIVGAALSFTSTLVGLLTNKENNEDTILSVFGKLIDT